MNVACNRTSTSQKSEKCLLVERIYVFFFFFFLKYVLASTLQLLVYHDQKRQKYFHHLCQHHRFMYAECKARTKFDPRLIPLLDTGAGFHEMGSKCHVESTRRLYNCPCFSKFTLLECSKHMLKLHISIVCWFCRFLQSLLFSLSFFNICKVLTVGGSSCLTVY